jgi:hypothetical protein
MTFAQLFTGRHRERIKKEDLKIDAWMMISS